MRNFEFYAPGNSNHMVHRYALRGVADGRRSYSTEKLLKAQYEVYKACTMTKGGAE